MADLKKRIEIEILYKHLELGKKGGGRLGELKKLAISTQVPVGKLQERFEGIRRGTYKWDLAVNRLKFSTRMFKMELLGVMFFGMGVQRFFTGLLKPSMDLVGVFDLWTTLLSVAFLRAGIKLLRWVMKLWELFSNLSPETKALINNFALLSAGIGTLLFLFGMLGLGLKSLSIAFSGWTGLFGQLFTAFSSFGSWLSTLGVGIGAFLAIAIIGIIGFVLAWKENFMNIKEFVRMIFDGIKQIFEGFVQVVKGIMGMVWSLFTADPKQFWDYFKQLVEGIGNILGGLVNIVTGVVGTITASFARALKGVYDFGYKIGEYIGAGFRDLIIDALSYGREFIYNFIKGMLGPLDLLFGDITNKIMDYFPSSPAKKGELKNIEKSGYEFMNLFYKGTDRRIKEKKGYNPMELLNLTVAPAVAYLSDEFTILASNYAEQIKLAENAGEASKLYAEFVGLVTEKETDSNKVVIQKKESLRLLEQMISSDLIQAYQKWGIEAEYQIDTLDEVGDTALKQIPKINSLAQSYRDAWRAAGEKMDIVSLARAGKIEVRAPTPEEEATSIKKKPKDFIIPSAGKEIIIPSPNDTIIGMQKGGAIGDIISNAVASAVGSLFGRIDINITAPSGYEATARMSGGRV